MALGPFVSFKAFFVTRSAEQFVHLFDRAPLELQLFTSSDGRRFSSLILAGGSSLAGVSISGDGTLRLLQLHSSDYA
ncbi:hypothetical protein EYF80_033711 [Liparis tanakae]|uniref:Uncharacterized protein n=1 Tax=Liparis tanakae TaxID=230148 RepID=A0A4Z2GS55_9TELE|nr:hypothetical protein EYF80_033711 [Liparis tanakae]